MNAPFTADTPALQRRAWWLLAVMHVPFFGFVIAQGAFNLALPAASERNPLAVVLAVAACALQFRHSIAAAAGVRPRYWQLTLGLRGVSGIVNTKKNTPTGQSARLVGCRW